MMARVSGVPIGVEITAPRHVTVEQVDALLRRLGFEGIEPDELSPCELRSRNQDAIPRLPLPERRGGRSRITIPITIGAPMNTTTDPRNGPTIPQT
jgi:hypothetical protein